MRKKIMSVILCLILSVSVLTGCSLFEHNNEKDARQIVVEIAPYEEQLLIVDRKDDNGNFVYKPNKVGYTTKKRVIYKSELMNQLNANAGSLLQQGMTLEQATNEILNQLITRELIIIEAEKRIFTGEIEWDKSEIVDGEEVKTYTESNAVKKLIYNTIDSQLSSFYNTILKERGEEVPPTSSGSEEEKSTTFPVPEVETDADEVDYEAWSPDKGRYPAVYGTNKIRSLQREGVKRLINLLEEGVKDDFRATETDKKAFTDDMNNINAVIASEGIEAVYPMLGDTAMVQWLIGESAEQQIQIGLLQEYILGARIKITDDDVEKKFTDDLTNQDSNYSSNLSQYETAIKDGKTTILFHPTDKYFYVKHILLPFSDKQTAALTKYKVGHNKKEIEDFRAGLAKNMVCYPHVNGENDLNMPMSAQQVFDEVAAVMNQKSTNPRDAERAFDNLIFKYNTDPGAFNNNMGYAVAYELAEGEAETYMVEFAEGARKLKDTGSIGEILPELIVTDYGVHIMYLANTISAGQKADMMGYTTPGEIETYFDILKTELKTARETDEFARWQEESILYYENKTKVITRNVDTYKNLYEQ